MKKIRSNEKFIFDDNKNILITSNARYGKTTRIENICLDLKNSKKPFVYFTNNEKICLDLYENIDILDNENFVDKFEDLIKEKKSFLVKLEKQVNKNSEKLILLTKKIGNYYICIDETEKFSLDLKEILKDKKFIITSQSINPLYFDIFDIYYIGRTMLKTNYDKKLNSTLLNLDVNEFYEFKDKNEMFDKLTLI